MLAANIVPVSVSQRVSETKQVLHFLTVVNSY